MSHSQPRSILPLWAVAGYVALGLGPLTPGPAAAQQSAPLQGVVAEEETGRLIPSATVTLVGAGIETRSGADGTFAFPDAPLGRVLVRVKAPGYPSVVEEGVVARGAIFFMPVFLRSAAAVLDELRVTVTRTDALHHPQAQTAADLLSVHLPELRPAATYVQRRAAPVRLGLRGRGTFTGSGEPTIVLDGARLTGGLDVLRQIPAAQVKSIRILRGPSAAFLDGSAGGVIYIQTESGPPAP